MKISSINKSQYSFKARYSTEDVLSFTTQYPYKNKDVQFPMVKSLSGIDMESDAFNKALPDFFDRNVAQLAITFLCIEKVLEQNSELRDVDDTFVPKVRTKEVIKEKDEWFKTQISRLGETMEIKPFTLDKKEIEEKITSLTELINEIF